MTSKSKRYYWMRTMTNFFRTVPVMLLLNEENGGNLVVKYQDLMLQSVVTEGVIKYSGAGENLREEIAALILWDIENTNRLLDKLVQMHLAVETEDELFLTYVPGCIGSETDAAERMRNYRKAKKVQICDTEDEECENDEQCYNSVDPCYTEKSREENIRIEKRREDIYQVSEIEKERV